MLTGEILRVRIGTLKLRQTELRFLLQQGIHPAEPLTTHRVDDGEVESGVYFHPVGPAGLRGQLFDCAKWRLTSTCSAERACHPESGSQRSARAEARAEVGEEAFGVRTRWYTSSSSRLLVWCRPGDATVNTSNRLHGIVLSGR